MIDEWFAPLDRETFWSRYFHRSPLATAASGGQAVPLLDWDTLGRVLASDQPIDLVTVTAGRLVEAPVPRTIDDARALLRAGVSVVVRNGERHDAGLRALADRFAAAVPGLVHVQLYATPGGTNSYGWHYDFEDVFIAQTSGIKDYYFRDNTIARDTRLGDALDFAVIRSETSPIFAARLLAADCLYIPSRWWHLVKCAEDALSISVGIMPPDELRRAARRPLAW